jgi:hypothetical protein
MNGTLSFSVRKKRCAAHLHGTPFRIRISSTLDFYLSWMDCLRFWESDFKHPVFVSCINLVSLDLVGNLHSPEECPVTSFHTVVLSIILFLFVLLLPFDGQHAV